MTWYLVLLLVTTVPTTPTPTPTFIIVPIEMQNAAKAYLTEAACRIDGNTLVAKLTGPQNTKENQKYVATCVQI